MSMSTSRAGAIVFSSSLKKVLGPAILLSALMAPVGAASRPGAAQPPTYADLKAQAERHYAEKSYARAHELYQQAQQANPPAGEARWVRFRLADTLWRKAPGAAADDATLRQARRDLEALIREIERPEDRDLIYAEANESLGDSHLSGARHANVAAGWPNHAAALEWWAQSSDLDAARQRYLSIVWRAIDAEGGDWQWRGRSNVVPLDVLRNVLEIAQSEQDRTRAHFEIAMKRRYYGGNDPRAIEQTTRHFEAALQSTDRSSRYVDALMAYAQWVESYGRVEVLEDGRWQYKPDFVKAASLYKRILDEFRPDQANHAEARHRYDNLVNPALSISVAQAFLPSSEIAFDASWRNVDRIEFTLHRVNLRERTTLEGALRRDGQDTIWYGSATQAWIRHVNLDGAEISRQWTYDTGDTGEHEPRQAQIRLDERLEPGAYVLVAKAKDQVRHELILVTDLAVVAKRRGKDVLLYACDALTGAPAPNVKLRAWSTQTRSDNRNTQSRWAGLKNDAAGDGQGIAQLDVGAGDQGAENHSLLIFADDGTRQTFLTSYAGSWYGSRQEVGTWRIYAHTDRPAYRPGETANFRFVARRWGKEGWDTPAGVELRYEIVDARNTTVLEGTAALSEFGSAFGSIDLKAEWPLGEYAIRFWRDMPTEKVMVYQSTLFRLEEYKLPEFTVAVEPARDENGKARLFRIGDVVEAHITAEYYFGGAVAAADVEVVVQQKPFAHWYRAPRRCEWYYGDNDNWNPYRWWGGQVVKRETIKTDAQGKATITFETPFSSDTDYEYTIEARVIDASRREITGSGTVRVTRQGHYVYPQVKHRIHRPGEKVETTIKALDANSTPLAVQGTITVTRQWWDEVWVDPAGREVPLADVRRTREQLGVFPPPPREGDRHPWRPIFRGYRSEKIMTEKVSTDEEGDATFTFTPQVEGYYVIDWVSPDPPLAPVTAQTVAWVTTQQSADLGYRTEGVEIIVDQDAFEVGSAAPVMISTSSSNRYVLFTVEGEELYEWRLIHVPGTVKLLSLDVRENHVPNVSLAATMVSGAEMHTSSQEIIVPPSKQFLDVTVSAEKESYLPGEEGTLTIRAVDFEGKPVSAEIAITAFDESVLYIQSEYAGDPRQFFYDRRQSNRVTTSGSLSDLRLLRLVRTKAGAYEDARIAAVEENKVVDQLAEAEGRDAQLGFAGRASLAKSAGGREDAAMERMRGMAPASRAMSDAAGGGPPAESGPPGRPGEPEPPIEVRTDFRATALWLASVITDADGTANVKVKFPQSLTRWKAGARANTSGSKFGMGDTSARTSKPVTVRLQAPRFFVVGDQVVVSYIVNNNTDEPMDVMPFASAKGLRYAGIRAADGRYHERLAPGNQRRIEPQGETRYDLLYIAEQAGTAEITVEVRVERQTFTDAVRMTYPVHEHGIEKFLAVSGKARGDQAVISLEIPEQRREGSTSMVVRVTPSMAVTMLDALPYLLDYPYGCVEQTMSRFLPAAIVNRTLTQLGLDAGDVAGRTFGGIEMVNGQPARPRDEEAKAQDLRRLDEIIAAGLKGLDEMQGEDGGWGWWKGNQSDRYMTAYVVWGLGLAREAEIDVAGDMITPGADWLVNSLVTARDYPDLQAWMLHAITASKATTQPVHRIEAVQIAFANLWEKRDRLSDAGRALLALSAHHLGKADEAKVLVRNLENGVIRDDRPDQSILVRNRDGKPAELLALAHWGSAGRYRYWYDGGIEATTLCLRAILAIDPDNALVEPATNWLIRNRRGAQWTNTRDTALAVLTLCDYLKASGELEATGEFEVMANGRLIGSGAVTKENILSAPAEFQVPEVSIRGGANDIRILRKKGDVTLYFAVQAKCFTLEEPVAEAGSEMFVRRDYYRLVPRKTLLGGVVYERVPLRDGEKVVSGDRIEVVLTIEGKNDYEYLVFEDLKPAGFEAVQVRSGEPMYAYELRRSAAGEKYEEGEVLRDDGRRAMLPGSIRGDQSDLTGRSRWIHQELRDRHVAFFIDQMPEGLWQVRYEARAEAPGRFHALPLLGHAMYVPEIRCNSREVRVTIEDRP